MFERSTKPITPTTSGPNIISCRLRPRWPANGKVSCGTATDTISNTARLVTAGCARNMQRSMA